MAINFTGPIYWLIVLLLGGGFVYLARRLGLRWWPAAVIRFLLVGLVLLGAALPIMQDGLTLFGYDLVFVGNVGDELPSREVMLVDQSESLPEDERNWLLMQAENWAASGPNRIVVLFGGETEVVWIGGEDWPALEGEASNLEGALEKADELLGDEPGHLILVSDGVVPAPANVDQLLSNLADAGHIFDAIQAIPRDGIDDLFVGPLWVPGDLWEGMAFSTILPIYSPRAGEGMARLWVNGQLFEEKTVALTPGPVYVGFSTQAGAEGIMTLEAEAVWVDDPFVENNRSYAAVEVFEAPNALFATSNTRDSNSFQRALERNGIEISVIGPKDLPATTAELEEYEIVFLHNLLANELSFEQMLALEVFVTELGNGLIVLGGRNSYSLGGYENTRIEEIMPVRLEPPPRTERPPVTFVMVLDRSGSMSGERTTPTNLKPITLAQEAAMRAIETLRAEDYIGVLTYATEARWDVEPRQLGSGLELRIAQDIVSQVDAGGLTMMHSALELAIRDAARARPTEQIHILLLSDGFSSDGDLVEFESLARLAKNNDITISTIALGLEADVETLSVIAQLGGGRYFRVEDPAQLPEILVAESRAARSENIQLGHTTVLEGEERHPVLAGFSLTDFPPLDGYNAVTSKVEQGAEDILVSANFQAPLLSVWQVGLGRVAAWMSDLGEDWAVDWRQWGGQGRFWTQVIRYALPDPSVGPAQTEINVGVSDVQVNLQLQTTAGVPVNFAYPEFSYVGVEGAVTSLAMMQVEAGVYRLSFPKPDEGAYRGVISYLDIEGVSDLAAPFVVNYPQEWQPASQSAGRVNMERWAKIGGGQMLNFEELMAEQEEVAEEKEHFDIMVWLLLALIIFWPIEIAIRRRWLPWS